MTTINYHLKNEADIPSPALIFYQDVLEENIQGAIRMAGSAGRLWPHIKTHKSADVTQLLMARGISRFKCATIAEAQMLADCGAAHILMAYPLVGPNVPRFLRLIARYPNSTFYAIGDDENTLSALSDAAVKEGIRVNTLLDVNMGMNRTGIATAQAPALYAACARMPGLALCGIHGYDGHHHDGDFALRCQRVKAAMEALNAAIDEIKDQGLACDMLVLAGTPSFPCHAREPQGYLSPGTVFFMDHGYQSRHPDLPFTPAAALLTRVVSHPAEGLFTLDLGSKGIATDPAGQRGIIVGLPQAEVVSQSEEHWVWRMPGGDARPEIGQVLYVIPTHICPCVALYDKALAAKDGVITAVWPITARNRMLDI